MESPLKAPPLAQEDLQSMLAPLAASLIDVSKDVTDLKKSYKKLLKLLKDKL